MAPGTSGDAGDPRRRHRRRRLLYPDDTVQHCGIALGVLGAGAHVLVNLPKQASGYNLFSHVIRNYSAVTGACMAFRKSVFEAVGGFDESYPLDFNDVDFCLKVAEAGWRVVYTPFAELRHFESRSARRIAFDALDQHRLMRRWEATFRRDPFYNVNLRRTRSISALRGKRKGGGARKSA